MSHAVSLAQDGLFGKACNILVSQGIAPNCDETWNLLVSKHPKNDCPSVPVLPQMMSPYQPTQMFWQSCVPFLS